MIREHIITVKDIINITNAELILGNENEICENFSRDSRKVNKQDIYLGIKGENINGSTFLKKLLQKVQKVLFYKI